VWRGSRARRALLALLRLHHLPDHRLRLLDRLVLAGQLLLAGGDVELLGAGDHGLVTFAEGVLLGGAGRDRASDEREGEEGKRRDACRAHEDSP